MVNECPDISDNWKGGVVATAKILGISPKTLLRYATPVRSYDGIRYGIGRNGRKFFLGRDIKSFWRVH